MKTDVNTEHSLLNPKEVCTKDTVAQNITSVRSLTVTRDSSCKRITSKYIVHSTPRDFL
jgi:hypothetical protein